MKNWWRCLPLLSALAMLTYFLPTPARAADCGEGVAPCSCGDRVITNTVLGGLDPVLRTACPCNGLIIASGVTLDVGGTIQWSGPNSCNDPFLFPTAILIETGASDVVIKHGRTVGFLYGVRGDSVTNSRITGLQVVNPEGGIILGFGPELFQNHMNTIQNNVIRDAGTGIIVSGNDNTVCQNRVEDSGEGIVESGTGNIVCRNVVSRILGQGISNFGNNGIFASNRVQYGGSGGVVVAGTGNVFTGNNALGNGTDGFVVLGTNNDFQRNVGDYNARFGFAEFSMGNGNVYEHNRCTGNAVGDSFPSDLCR